MFKLITFIYTYTDFSRKYIAKSFTFCLDSLVFRHFLSCHVIYCPVQGFFLIEIKVSNKSTRNACKISKQTQNLFLNIILFFISITHNMLHKLAKYVEKTSEVKIGS